MPDFVPLTPVDSSLIRAIGYDAGSRTLAIQFQPTARQGKRTEHRHNVPPELHEAFMKAPSKGVFFGRAIASKFSYHVVPNQGRCPKCGDIGLEGCTCDDCGCDVYKEEE